MKGLTTEHAESAEEYEIAIHGLGDSLSWNREPSRSLWVLCDLRGEAFYR
jgi:hypothetical protein